MFENELVGVLPNFAVWIIVLLSSMIPLIECRGAIPLGVSAELWGSSALTVWQSALISFVGSSLVAVLILLTFVPIKKLLRKSKKMKKLLDYFENSLMQKFIIKLDKFNKKYKNKQKTSKKLHKIEEKKVHSTDVEVNSTLQVKKKAEWLKVFVIFGITALPLPMSGVWTSSILSSLVGLKFFKGLFSVVLGNLVACLLVAFISAIFIEFINLILVILAVILVLFIIYKIIEMCVNLRTKKVKKIEEKAIELNN